MDGFIAMGLKIWVVYIPCLFIHIFAPSVIKLNLTLKISNMDLTFDLVKDGVSGRFDTTTLDKLHKRANHELTKLIKHNEMVIQSIKNGISVLGLKFYLINRSTIVEGKSGHGFIFFHICDPITQQNYISRIESETDNIKRYLKKNDIFIGHIHSNKLRPTDYLLVPTMSFTENNNIWLKATVVHKRDKSICLKCGESIAPSRLAYHEKTESQKS